MKNTNLIANIQNLTQKIQEATEAFDAKTRKMTQGTDTLLREIDNLHLDRVLKAIEADATRDMDKLVLQYIADLEEKR